MKLLTTTIKPRADGTVRATCGEDTYVFRAETKGGPLVADVENEEHVVRLLLTDNFEPANEEDHDRAERLLGQLSGDDKLEDGDPDDQDDEDEDEDDDEGAGAQGALPIEANTPPAAIPGRVKRPRRVPA